MVDNLQFDNPLSNPEEDILERKNFSKALAESIISLDSSQGFVYGLYGPWGSGKSTVINFVEHYINNHNKEGSPETRVVIFRFNPWMFSGSENLTKVFLNQLRARLCMKDVSEDLQKVSKVLELIEIGLSITTPVANIIVPGSGNIFGRFLRCISSITNITDSVSEATKKDLHHIKEDVTSVLQEQNDKILVVIDDLDRLFDDEIRDFIKMIKAVCDFPKVIYLIACDSEKVANALNHNTEDNADGYEYLEKIVQCPFNLPRPGKQNLHNLFFNDLDKIFGPIVNKGLLFDETEWGNIFHDGVAPHLRTPRNVKTLINSIRTCYPSVRKEVNVSDFVGVQVLRIFYQKAYNLIDNNKNFFAGSTVSSYGSEYDKEAKEAFYNQLHSSIPKPELDSFKQLMSRLFPKYAQSVSTGMGYGHDWETSWKKKRKVCSEECFDLYFMLSIPEDSFSLEEMQRIISLADTPVDLKAKLRSFIEADKEDGKGVYKHFLQELEVYTEDEISKDKIMPLLQAIYDVSDEVGPDDNYRSFMEIGIDMNMLRISYQLTIRFDDEKERFNLLKDIFEKSESVSMVIGKAFLIDSKQENKVNIVSSGNATELIEVARRRLKEFADNNKLPKAPHFANNLYRWRDWEEDQDTVKHYVTKLIETDEGLIDFLTGFLSMSMSHAMGDKVVEKKYRLPHEGILNFIEIETLENCVKRAITLLRENKELNSRAKKALETFVEEKDNPKSDWD